MIFRYKILNFIDVVFTLYCYLRLVEELKLIILDKRRIELHNKKFSFKQYFFLNFYIKTN